MKIRKDLRAAGMICTLTFFGVHCSSAGNPAAPKVSAFAVEEITVAQTQEAIRSHRVTCRQLVEIYLKRIAAYDQPTRLNSIVTLNPQAVAEAERLDEEFAHTHRLRALQGVVVIVKDNYDTRGLQTTGGSLAMKWFQPTQDAFMVRRLREAGAIVLAKSNMAEWAFSPVLTESSIAGITRNPYALDRVPAGSSGGTAAAVAANLGEVGLGTDTGDSIRGPASHNDLVGIRPTIGLTSRAGIIPLSATNDVGGPLARSVADAAAVLAAVQGFDPEDPITERSEGKAPADYATSLDRNGLKGARIALVRSYVDTPTTDPQIKALVEKAIADLRAQGATVVESFPLPEFDRAAAQKRHCGGFEHDLNEYLAKHPNAPYHTVQEIIDSGLYLGSVEQRLKRGFGGPPKPKDPKAPSAASPTEPCPDTYHDPEKIKFREAISAEMDRQHLDALIYPTWSNPPRKVGDLKSPGGDNSQIICPMTGFPGITVPMGYTYESLPAGLTFVGRAFSEALLIKFAYAYEQATRHRHAPPVFGPLP